MNSASKQEKQRNPISIPLSCLFISPASAHRDLLRTEKPQPKAHTDVTLNAATNPGMRSRVFGDFIGGEGSGFADA